MINILKLDLILIDFFPDSLGQLIIEFPTGIMFTESIKQFHFSPLKARYTYYKVNIIDFIP